MHRHIFFMCVFVFAILCALPQISEAGFNASDVLGTFDESGNPSFTVSYNNGGQLATRYGFGYPYAMALDPVLHRLYVADEAYRILVFNLSTDNQLVDRDADFVLGQPDFESNSAPTAYNASTFYNVYSLALDTVNQLLYVVDRHQYRILVFDLSGGITNGMDASYVLGQPDFETVNDGSGSPPISEQFRLAWNNSL